MQQHDAEAWLVNTGWTGGAYGVGTRIKLAYTRAIIDAIHSGELAKAPTQTDPIFGLAIPTACPGVPSEILSPQDPGATRPPTTRTAAKLAELFRQNFADYADQATEKVQGAGPK